VYYFRGDNEFGPIDGDATAWTNPFDWGKDVEGKIVSGQGIPGSGDTAVFKGSTEDGKAWTVYPSPFSITNVDVNGHNSARITSGASVATLNLDRTWDQSIIIDEGQTLSLGEGRWHRGTIAGNVSNTGNLSIVPEAGVTFKIGNGTFTNSGTVSQTGRVSLGFETGVVLASGVLNNRGNYTFSGELTRASNPDSRIVNEGKFNGSGILSVNATST
jgi:hypothetical protein